MKKRIFKIALALCIPAMAGAQTLTLDEAIKIALENNYDVVAASNAKEVGRLQNHVGNAGMLPRISLNGSAGYGLNALRQEFSNGLEVNNPRVSNRNFSGQAILDWVIFDGLRMFAVKRRLTSQYEMADLALKDQVQKTVGDVIRIYTTLAAETKRMNGLQTTVDYFDELAKLAEGRQKIGSGNRQEALQSIIDKNAQKSLVLRQRATLISLKMQLNTLLNRDPKSDFEVDTVVSVNKGLLLEDGLANASTANPSVLIAEKNAAVFKSYLKEQQSYQMPTIAVNLGYSYNYSGSSAGFALFNQTNGMAVGATLAFPIFDGWRVRRNIKTAKVQYENAKYAAVSVRLRIESEVRAAYEAYLRNLEILELEEESVRLAEQNMQIATERYKAGLGTLIESRAATLSYSDAQTRYALAQSDSKTAELTLLILSGQLVK